MMMMKMMSSEGIVGGSVTEQGKASPIGRDVQTHTYMRTAKWQSNFQKLVVGVNIRLARHSAGGLSAGFMAHHAHSKHVSWLFWVVPTPSTNPL